MSRVYWDTMLFVYWLEDKEPYSSRIASIYARMSERGDTLCSSAFGLAELLVAPFKRTDRELEGMIRDFYSSGAVQILPFDVAAAERFAQIRASTKVKPADAIHLACASSARVDLFLTNDSEIRKLVIPGIAFVDSIETSVLGPIEDSSALVGV